MNSSISEVILSKLQGIKDAMHSPEVIDDSDAMNSILTEVEEIISYISILRQDPKLNDRAKKILSDFDETSEALLQFIKNIISIYHGDK